MRASVVQWVICAVLMGILAGPAPAHASDTALLLEASGDATPRDMAHALTTVREGLVASGLAVVSAHEASKRLSKPGLSACENSACATSVLRELGAVMAVSVSTWKPNKTRAVGKVSVILSDDAGREVSEDVALDGGMSVREAAGRALAGALSDWPPLSPVPVEITSDPIGAVVTLDRSPLGETPATAQIKPGRHDVTLTREGYAVLRDALEVGNQPERVQRFAFTLLPEGAASPGTERLGPVVAPRDGAAADDDSKPLWEILVGSVLVAGGVGLGAQGVVGFARDGEVIDGGASRLSADATTGIILGAGVVALGTGIYLLAK
jgi:hypothetical protein